MLFLGIHGVCVGVCVCERERECVRECVCACVSVYDSVCVHVLLYLTRDGHWQLRERAHGIFILQSLSWPSLPGSRTSSTAFPVVQAREGGGLDQGSR